MDAPGRVRYQCVGRGVGAPVPSRGSRGGEESILLHVIIDVLHVFIFLKFLKQFVKCHALLFGHLLEVVGYALKLGADNLKAILLEVFL